MEEKGDDRSDAPAAVNEGTAKPPPLTRAVPLLWGLVALALAALGAAGVLVVLRAARGPRPSFLDAPSASAAAPAPPAKAAGGSVVLVGSGSNLPLTRALVLAFQERRAGVKVVVPESIGSTGGVRAVADGAISAALISRALNEREARLGLTVTPYARVPVIVAANPSVPDACIASADLPALYAGARPAWSDGSRAVVLQREQGDSSFLAMSRLISGLAAANDAAYHEERWRVLYDDRAMQEALMATEGAAGIFDLGAVVAQRLPIKILCVDGAAASAEAVRSGRYPYFKDLAFVTAGPPAGRAAQVIDFVLSAEGRSLAGSLGYLPLPLEPAPEGGGPR